MPPRYGCVFCRTTHEKTVARMLEDRCCGLEAMPISQIKHRSINGKKQTTEQILLPGYVFFCADRELPYDLYRGQHIIRLLKNPEGSWKLAGGDEVFARLVFERGGIIGLSKARMVGDRVQIISGPLRDMEGSIVKIDRRGRNGQVEFRFDDRVWKVWLAFEMVE